MAKDRCKLPIGWCVIYKKDDNGLREIVKYLEDTGVENPHCYVGTGTENLGRAKDNTIQYSNQVRFDRIITLAQFRELIAQEDKPEYKDNYLIFN
jgi:hypothetical protein